MAHQILISLTGVSFASIWPLPLSVKSGAYILNLTGGNPALASVGTNVTQRPMTGKPLFGDRIAAKTGAAAAGEPARQAKYVSP